MKGVALNNALADNLLEGKAKILRDTMGDVKAKPSTRWPTPYNWRRPRESSRHYAM